MRLYDITLPSPHEGALRAVGEAAEIWGAEWQRLGTGGRLELPVRAGLRHGELRGEVTTEPAGAGTRVVFSVEDSSYSLLVPHFVVLLLGGAGGLMTVVVPFYTQLLGLLPLAGLFMLLAWFLVASRYRSSGADEFLALVAELDQSPEASSDEEDGGDAELRIGQLSRRSRPGILDGRLEVD